MATNVTKDPLQFMLQQLKNAEIHLDAAEDRLKKAKEKQKKKKAELGPKYKRPDLPDTNSEIENLKIKISNLKYCIDCIQFTQLAKANENTKYQLYVYGTNRNIVRLDDPYKEIDRESDLPIGTIESLTLDDPLPTILDPNIFYYIALDTKKVFIIEPFQNDKVHLRLRYIGQVYYLNKA